ncbi:D-lactaldehyde dehydrogenase [Auriscalpium vulgare]|uniref:D-lactaldehyde dehydrogenase n=1 Tax=Auriscalpium vulgare TaxID=40419 RepID=A0ACB8S5R1_9AGAM|nr:D-lactaldehyde dehydrogenase [Auriscalpium vulgare]
MVAVPTPSKVLVTGANGFVAVWIVRKLLEAGYPVRGTVRAANKGAHLKKIFSEYGDKLEIFVVEDITKTGAFDEAVKGVDLVEHTASPFHFAAQNPDELIVPAVKGTLSVLESVKNHGSSVKRVVLTGSSVSVLRAVDKPTVFTEADWNEWSVNEVKTKGEGAGSYPMYQVSKTLAEKAAWEFIEKDKGALSWDLVVLNPPWIFGPPIHELKNLDDLNSSQAEVLRTIAGGKSPEELVVSSNWIDVRDVATAHVLAAQKPEAGGERLILNEGNFYWQDLLDAANAISPPPLPNLPKGDPSATAGVMHELIFITEKSTRILGFKYTHLRDTVKDSIADFIARGYRG